MYEQSDSKVGWSVANSVWNKLVIEESDKYVKCFEYDWQNISEKLPKMLKDDETEKNKVKNVLKNNQRKIRQWYKY